MALYIWFLFQEYKMLFFSSYILTSLLFSSDFTHFIKCTCCDVLIKALLRIRFEKLNCKLRMINTCSPTWGGVLELAEPNTHLLDQLFISVSIIICSVLYTVLFLPISYFVFWLYRIIGYLLLSIFSMIFRRIVFLSLLTQSYLNCTVCMNEMENWFWRFHNIYRPMSWILKISYPIT